MHELDREVDPARLEKIGDGAHLRFNAAYNNVRGGLAQAGDERGDQQIADVIDPTDGEIPAHRRWIKMRATRERPLDASERLAYGLGKGKRSRGGRHLTALSHEKLVIED